MTELNNQDVNLMNALDAFTGTQQYHKGSLGILKLTDGINYLRNAANCYWLIDIVESVQNLKEISENREFVVWMIEISEDARFKVTAWKDTPYESELLYEQKGRYTDFPLDDFEFYQCGKVLLLKSEY